MSSDILVTRQSEARTHRLLKGYRRLGSNACKRTAHVERLTVLVKQDRHYWYTLRPDTIDDVLEMAEDGTRSLCSTLLLDLFGLSKTQYAKIVKEFVDPKGSSGVWINKEGHYAIVVHLPGDRAWYDDSRMRTVGGLALGAGVALGYKWGAPHQRYY